MVKRVLWVESVGLILRSERPQSVNKLPFHRNGASLEHVRVVREVEDVALEERLLVRLELVARYALHRSCTPPGIASVGRLVRSVAHSTSIVIIANLKVFFAFL